VSLAGLLNQAVMVVRRSQTGAPDDYGTPTWDMEIVETVCHVQPVAADEMVERPAGRITYRAWFPAGTVIGEHDRIVLASGLEAEVAGPALRWHNPRRRDESHIVVDLVHVTDEAEPEVS
jgi:hypothetical protein